MAGSREFIDALDLLTEQHTEVEQLFKMFEAGRSNRRAALVELADKLAAHTTIEEKLFYPCVMSEQTRKLLHDALEEHLRIKRLIADMRTMDLGASNIEATIAVLHTQVSHHARVEELRLFPIVRQTMNAKELAIIGNELKVMFGHLMAAEPLGWVPDETTQAVALPI